MPDDAPKTAQEWEDHSVAHDLWRIETTCDDLIARGYRVGVMLTIEKIIREHGLDRFPRVAAE